MVEVWLRYGRTSIFTDLQDPFQTVTPTKVWSGAADLTETLAQRIEPEHKQLIIDYVHGLVGFDLVVKATAEAMARKHIDMESVNVFVSGWRYADPEVEKSFVNMVKTFLSELKIKKVGPLPPNPSLQKSIIISPCIYWNGQAVTHIDFLKRISGGIDGITVAPVAGAGGVVAEVFTEENIDADHVTKAVENAASYTTTQQHQVIIAGGPGYPMDSKLSTCINLVSSVENLESNKVVIFALECADGLGEKEFVKALLGESDSEDNATKDTLKIWRTVAERHKLCMVTALPATVVEKVLGAKQFDTLDQAIVYARRVKGREASTLFAENVLGTRMHGF